MIFVDASAWYTLLMEKDVHHAEARAFFKEVATGTYGAPLTTDYVLDEAFTILRMKGGLGHVRTLSDLIRRSPAVRRIGVSNPMFDQSLDLMLAHADKRWSFTDCTSFVTMRETGITSAFTLDHNFEEAGFHVFPEKWR